jgi:hypothetical protein
MGVLNPSGEDFNPDAKKQEEILEILKHLKSQKIKAEKILEKAQLNYDNKMNDEKKYYDMLEKDHPEMYSIIKNQKEDFNKMQEEIVANLKTLRNPRFEEEDYDKMLKENVPEEDARIQDKFVAELEILKKQMNEAEKTLQYAKYDYNKKLKEGVTEEDAKALDKQINATRKILQKAMNDYYEKLKENVPDEYVKEYANMQAEEYAKIIKQEEANDNMRELLEDAAIEDFRRPEFMGGYKKNRGKVTRHRHHRQTNVRKSRTSRISRKSRKSRRSRTSRTSRKSRRVRRH